MSDKTEFLSRFFHHRHKPAVKRLSELLINRVTVMLAKHCKGLTDPAFDFAPAAVGKIIK